MKERKKKEKYRHNSSYNKENHRSVLLFPRVVLYDYVNSIESQTSSVKSIVEMPKSITYRSSKNRNLRMRMERPDKDGVGIFGARDLDRDKLCVTDKVRVCKERRQETKKV